MYVDVRNKKLREFLSELGYKQLSHEKNPYYFPLYWLVHKDPYNGLSKSLYNWVV